MTDKQDKPHKGPAGKGSCPQRAPINRQNIGSPKLYDRKSTMLAIAERLSAGETMVSICAEPQMPSAVTVWQWCQEDDELDRIYVQTKKPRARALIEQSAQQLQRLLDDNEKVDTRKIDVFVRNAQRLAGILDPENFSDKMHAHLGKLGQGNVINIQLNIGR